MLITIKIVIIDLLFTSFQRWQHQQPLTLSRHETPSLEQNGFGRSTSLSSYRVFNDSRLSFLFSIIFYSSSARRQKRTRYHSTETRHGLRFARSLFCFDFRFEPFLPHRHDCRAPVRRLLSMVCSGVTAVVGVDDVPRLPVPR